MIALNEMNNRRLQSLIQGAATEILEDQLGFWKFEFSDRLIFVITDEGHNRMRIMSPVGEAESIPEEEWSILMAANFDRALDARYCVNNEMLWSAFIHPLKELSDSQFLDGLSQTATLAKNYGTTYISSDIVFGG